jgi:hypothetical protein
MRDQGFNRRLRFSRGAKVDLLLGRFPILALLRGQARDVLSLQARVCAVPVLEPVHEHFREVHAFFGFRHGPPPLL